jgi:hypothetical protein
MADMIYCVCPGAPRWEQQFKDFDLLPDSQHECKNHRGEGVKCGRAPVELKKDMHGVERLYAVNYKGVRIVLHDEPNQVSRVMEIVSRG